ncbi:integral membrane sensor signal transduction histidine kinase [Paenibacillus curdlanolyticus YK9]|uniref:histidine kinase n=1 Tax=Paenibacillus curdlanolyticus YK9 TaxID=717606 RepID=E0I658_9BACL|nr:HAMP domain-containing sensor histidine kinase [Paenibacillus curdlanolyticus]EFM12450.1 integral membrane sensor signal transduction histidine kinase [Paenibacillus curdlanolyticus YK9]
MLYYMFALMTGSMIALLHDWRSASNRWAACFLFFAAIGGSTDLLEQSVNGRLADWADFLNQTVTPYALLVFCLVFTGQLERMRAFRQAITQLALLAPVGVMAIITPFSPELRLNYWVMLTWTSPYYLGACWLLLLAYRREREPARRRTMFITVLVMVPTVLAVTLFIVLGRALYPQFDYFQYVAVFFAYSLVVALPGVFFYGVIGVKLRFERDSMASTMQAVGSGAALLQHTVKNEIGKIAMGTENLKSLMDADSKEAVEQLAIIERAAEQMIAMTERLHERMRVITLVQQPCRWDTLLDALLAGHRMQCEALGIQLHVRYATRPVVVCDPVHLREAISNILANAMEAMPAGGQLTITVEAKRRYVRLSVRDTGKGIPLDEQRHVFEPFYSTKKRTSNYGLGLSYVYMFMQRSGGSVELYSRIGEGTIITLQFPRTSLVQV